MPRAVPARAPDVDRAGGETPDRGQGPDQANTTDHAASDPAQRDGPAPGRARAADMGPGL